MTISNGICGSQSVFSSARYLISNDKRDLYMALAFPLAGLMFDFLDGKVARWRNSSSMLGQELDSLADLVRPPSHFLMTSPLPSSPADFVRSRTRAFGILRRPKDTGGYDRLDGVHLCRTGEVGEVQCHRCAPAGEGEFLRGIADP